MLVTVAGEVAVQGARLHVASQVQPSHPCSCKAVGAAPCGTAPVAPALGPSLTYGAAGVWDRRQHQPPITSWLGVLCSFWIQGSLPSFALSFAGF